jgi:hypothetical protein
LEESAIDEDLLSGAAEKMFAAGDRSRRTDERKFSH